MKFVLTPDIRKNRPLCQLLIFFYLCTLVLLALGVQFERFKWGLTHEKVRTKIFGNEELFIDPIDLQVMVGEIHIELFIYIFLVVMVLLVYQKAQQSASALIRDSFVLFALILSNSLSPLFSYFFSDVFIYLKIISFPLLTAILAIMSFKNIHYLYKKPPPGETVRR